MLAQSSKTWKLCNDDLTFLWKIGLVCPPNPACFESYRRFPWAKLLAFPALYCETLWIVCFLHFFDLQKVRLVLGTFTILFSLTYFWVDDHYKFQSITQRQKFSTSVGHDWDSIQFCTVYLRSTKSKFYNILWERQTETERDCVFKNKNIRRVMSDTEQKTEGEQQVETPELSRILPLGMYF